MKILYFIFGIGLYLLIEIFSVPNRKKKIQDQIFDYGIFYIKPIKGIKAVYLLKFTIYFFRIGIIIYIALGIYIFYF